MSRYHGPERRRYYRLKYPAPLRPIAAIDGRPYVVVEISECGMRFHHVERICEEDEEIESLWIRFSDGELVEVGTAHVVRRHDDETAVEFDHAVSFDRMVKEQMSVIRGSFPAPAEDAGVAPEDRAAAVTEAEGEAIVRGGPARPRTAPRTRLRFSQLRRLHDAANDS